jgi:hypothetical protein
MPCPPLTTIEIARAWALHIAEDRTLKAWVQENFQRELTVNIGEDIRRLPEADDAPWVSIFPLVMRKSPQSAQIEHDLMIVAGVRNENFTNAAGPCREMDGIVQLSCTMVPLLEKCMAFAVPGVASLQTEVEFAIDLYPLLEAIITTTVTETRPVGGRNR